MSKHKIYTISLDPEMHKEGLSQSQKIGIKKFSGYIAYLIAQVRNGKLS